ncbi:hypothetical protein FHW64_004013 [Variovorax sp. Sphag1AA]|nr:hypothetical protein [Variovorax sp. Sphag1AA]
MDASDSAVGELERLRSWRLWLTAVGLLLGNERGRTLDPDSDSVNCSALLQHVT